MRKKAKHALKYYYYKTLCKLLGRNALINVYDSTSGSGKAKSPPGKSAVILHVKGKISGVGYSRWFKRKARSSNVKCWIKKRGKKRADILLVGPLGNIAVVAQSAWKGPKKAKVKDIKEKWFYKQRPQAVPTEDVLGKKFTITFGGDTSLGDYYLRKHLDDSFLERLEKQPFSFFEGVKSLTDKSDHFIINLETVLADNPQCSLDGKEYPNWDNPERTISVLKQLGVTAVSLANNHAMDFGPKIMLKTSDQLRKAGIKIFGAGSDIEEASAPLKLELKGECSTKKVYIFTGMRASKRYWEKFKFFADKDAPGVNPLDLDRLIFTIADLRKQEPDALIIVCPHWQGSDYKWVSPKIVDICRSLIVAGADFVFAHGTHTANHIEKTKKGTIAFSIGNFVFNSPGRYRKLNALPYSMLVKLNVEENNGEWKAEPHFYPIVTDNKRTDFNVRPVDEKELNQLYGELVKRTDNSNKFATIYKKNKSSAGYFISTEGKEDLVLHQIILNQNKISQINFRDIRVLGSHLDQLRDLQKQLDDNLFVYYERLLKNKIVRLNRDLGKSIGRILMGKIGHVAKKEYISHASIRKFERRKIKVEKAISFREIMIEKSVARRLGCPEYAWMLDRKTLAYKFADLIGLRRPKNELKTYKLSEIEEQQGPVVIKPVHATGSMGVYLVFDKNNIFSARERTYLNSWSELKDDANKKLEASEMGRNFLLRRDEWIIEELILNPKENYAPPNDLKFYMFYGEVLIVLEMNRAYSGKYRFWDANMRIAKTGKYEDQDEFDGDGFTKEDLEIVAKASLQIPSPFIRLDMLKGREGLVFGEATPRPGRFHLFSDEYDKKLGEAYRKAEARILKDLLNGKKFEAFTNMFEI